MAAERAGAGAVAPACRQKCTQVSRAERVDIGDPGRRTEMAGQEAQELAGVAFIGLQRVGGKASLPGKVFEPFRPSLEKVGSGDRQYFAHVMPIELVRVEANLT